MNCYGQAGAGRRRTERKLLRKGKRWKDILDRRGRVKLKWKEEARRRKGWKCEEGGRKAMVVERRTMWSLRS